MNISPLNKCPSKESQFARNTQKAKACLSQRNQLRIVPSCAFDVRSCPAFRSHFIQNMSYQYGIEFPSPVLWEDEEVEKMHIIWPNRKIMRRRGTARKGPAVTRKLSFRPDHPQRCTVPETLREVPKGKLGIPKVDDLLPILPINRFPGRFSFDLQVSWPLTGRRAGVALWEIIIKKNHFPKHKKSLQRGGCPTKTLQQAMPLVVIAGARERIEQRHLRHHVCQLLILECAYGQARS